jgi:predicted N-acetyltransferase YhbS
MTFFSDHYFAADSRVLAEHAERSFIAYRSSEGKGGATLENRSEIRICNETAADIPARERLLDQAFGPTRFQKTCARLREGRLPAQGLSLVAKDVDDELIGTLRLWHIQAGKVEALLLGPLAVAATHRSQGLGRKLIGESLYRALCSGYQAVLLVGDAPYYAAFGFERTYTQNLNLPGPVDDSRFLGLELTEGALAQASGLVRASGAIDLAASRSGLDRQQAA